MTGLQEIKAAARKAAFARRRAAAEDTAAAQAAQAHLLAHLQDSGAGVISGYMKIRTEIDPLPVMTRLHALGRRICVPVIEGAERPLAFREWRPGARMVAGPFGAVVPASGDWLEPTALIVPLLAFDARGYRLGYGGGFYDRTLEGLRGRGPVEAVGFAFAAQEAAEVPVEPTDQRLDLVVTEGGPRRFG
jgi:5-formyltetrahydrofolate cyclo-ligase